MQQLHQRLDEQNSKSTEQLDISKQFQSQLESIFDQIDQLNTGVNQVLLNKIQNLDDKTAQLAKTVENIIIKRDEPREGKQKRKSIDQSNDQNQKRRRLSKAKGSISLPFLNVNFSQFRVFKNLDLNFTLVKKNAKLVTKKP